MAEVDFDRTLSENRLVLKDDSLMPRFSTYILVLVMVFTTVSYARSEHDEETRKYYLLLMVPAVLILACWLIYKQMTEFRLLRVASPLSIADNKKIVEATLLKQGWDIEYKRDNCIQAMRTAYMTRDLLAIIIFDEGEIKSDVVYYLRWRNNIPILFESGNLKRCIERDINIAINPDADKEYP